MKRKLLAGFSAYVLAVLAGSSAGVAQPYTASTLIAAHCIECHRVPGFAAEARNPDVTAPDFQAMADDPNTYTTARLAAFLRKPHFPMREYALSQGDIQMVIAFIEGLRAGRSSVD